MIAATTRVAVIRGGTGFEYAQSLESGSRVLAALSESHHLTPCDIVVSREGEWLVDGVARLPVVALRSVDAVVNTLRSAPLRDGESALEHILAPLGTPAAGTHPWSAALALHKGRAKDLATRLGIATPLAVLIREASESARHAAALFRSFPHPSVVKPARGGSSLGISYAQTAADLERGMRRAFVYSPDVLIEEYLHGVPITCLAVEGFRGEAVYVFPPACANLPREAPILSEALRENAAAPFVCPAPLSRDEKRMMTDASRALFYAAHLRHYASFDFIASPRRGIFFLEMDTEPALEAGSPWHAALESVGVSPRDLFSHIVAYARGERDIA